MPHRQFWLILVISALLFTASSATAQSTSATLNGTVVDPSGAVVPNVKITAINAATSLKRDVTTNGEGFFSVALLPPGTYSLRASRASFARVEISHIALATNDTRTFSIRLKVGATSESMKVDASAISAETSSSVSTVVDTNFIEELPLKGRSFQALLLMTPGVVNSAGQEAGQLSVNGMRTNANYWTIDGVSANVGVGIGQAGNNVNQTFTGAIPGFNAFGATNGLISVDALQEFKVQTSSYSAEFGRQPGAQVQLTTRSGTNQYHGVLYEYLRNDIFEANDWFSNRRGDPKPRTRLNDFGGTFSGPMVKDRTFFFFSYEGMRYRHPAGTSDTYVPSTTLRNDARIDPGIRALLNAFPVSTAADNSMPDPNDPNSTILDGTQNYTFWQSSPMNMDSISLRMDQVINSKWTLFGRYNYAPSNQQIWSLNQLQSTEINMQTLTAGLTGVLTPSVTNQVNFNYSTSGGDGNTVIESIQGAVAPSEAQLFGGQIPQGNTKFASWYFLGWPGNAFGLNGGDNTQNRNRSLNITDGFNWSRGTHLFKFGVDFRRNSPRLAPHDYSMSVGVYSLNNLYSNTFDNVSIYGINQATIISDNISFYAQDSWKVKPRLTLELGVRWEINPPPHGLSPTDLIFVKGWENPATMTIAPEGTQGYPTDFHALAPRVGATYLVHQNPGWETVLRGGFGLFYDLGSATAAYGANGGRSGAQSYGVSYPFSSSVLAAPPKRTYPTPPYDQYAGTEALVGTLDNWASPRTYQWNVGLQQGIGKNQTVTLTYVGNAAGRLARSYNMTSGLDGYGNPNFPDWAQVLVTRNDAGYGDSSDYHAMQVQFQRQMARGLQILSNYTWAHAIDTASQDTNIFEYAFPSLRPTMTRGNSDNDRRQTFNAAMTYQLPSLNPEGFSTRTLNNIFVRGWAVDGMYTVQSGVPLNVTFTRDTYPFDPNGVVLRPDLVPGQAVWISDSAAPGGKRLNMSAFTLPANAMGEAQQLTQGNLQRNMMRTPGSWQLDASVGRDFKITERFKLQYRCESFNVFNHPNFAGYDTSLGFYSPNWGNYPENPSRFGRATTLLGLGGQGGSLGMIPLFSNGGPRSVQMALKLVF
jgi:hypothetical protein